MATLAFSVAGQVVGGLVGGPFGATVGRALGALAGSAIDSVLFGEDSGETVGRDVRLQSATEGGAISRIYGWNRVAGNIIWATELERIAGQSAGAKGLSSQASESETISANFAVALCEGEVTHLGRIWADGELLDTEGLNIRFYNGSETQLVDSLISAKQDGIAAAYRGVCYLVFERLPLEPFGNRIPNISAELCRSFGDLEKDIRAITVIPGSTEFGYDPTPRVRIVGPGAVETENAHMLGQTSDWTVSIDELQGICPNLEHVALVVAWFGDDLRCGQCNVSPRVEGAEREIKGTEWVVSGLGRADVPVISAYGGGPAYGGTPSDPAVIAAIADLKARGLKVTLYPILLMDIAQNNDLTDPYTQNVGQSGYPWRGRITCNPAPGVSGSPDKSVAVASQIAAFSGGANAAHFSASGNTVNYSGPVDGGYKRLVLHYARLGVMAGGVDAILVGSEMRGLSFLRQSATQFPFVDVLKTLAADVRAIVGSATKITYAADWSEYSGLQPADAPGDKIFHLDPLWASPHIDAIGIDNYMPLSDWRDGEDNADLALTSGPYDINYLQANIAGAEGYDWFYASAADRTAGNRSPITDGAHNEPWVWRYKDLVNWWSHAHHNRVGGVRSATPTAWVPGSKPFWLTELGCGAVDKGSNAPNAFGDPKSSEDKRPYFSSGQQDTLIQRQFLRAHHQWWRPDAHDFADAHNPISAVYGERMLDPSRIYLWTWDARPFPAFPNMLDVWSDGGNYATGHWLTGRLGATSLAEIIAAVAKDYGTEITARFSGGLNVHGFQIEGVVSMRDAIGPLLEAANLTIVASPEGLAVIEIGGAGDAVILKDQHVATENAVISRKRADASGAIGQLGFGYLNRQNAYLTGTMTAYALEGAGHLAVNSGLVVDADDARIAAEQLLKNAILAEDVIEFSLPPSLLALDVGDVISVENQTDGPFVISEVRDGAHRRLSARAVSSPSVLTAVADARVEPRVRQPATGAPLIAGAHLPPATGQNLSRLVFGAVAKPWPGQVLIEDRATGTRLAELSASATMGKLLAPLAHNGAPLWDNQSVLRIVLFDGHLASTSKASVFAGSNRALVERDDGNWEMIAFEAATLVSGSEYLLSGLVRGLDGTANPDAISSAERRFVVLDNRLATIDVPHEILGGDLSLLGFAGRIDAVGTSASAKIPLDPVQALAPTRVRVRNAGNDLAFDWIRRNRRDGNSWAVAEIPLDATPERYRVKIFEGATLKRSMETGTSSIVYDLSNQIADFGAAASEFNYEIAQISPVFGAGHSAKGTYNG